MTVEVELPPELAPSKRAAVEALLAEVPTTSAPEPQRGSNRRGRCYVCQGTRGAMGGHHVIPGDDSSVVPVHRRCHVKLHRKPKRAVTATA